jgi:hypothetical protein
MEDVLDFSADFWEQKLDYEPQNVDTIYSKETKGLSYAIDDYCGFDPVLQWMQTLPEAGNPISCSGSSQSGKRRGKGRRTKAAQGDKHLSLANSKSYD